MYVRRLHVQHLKRLRDFQLDFRHAGHPRMWTVLIGEDGTAKTTLLQAIALAATGSKQVNTLAGPVVRHLRDRRGDASLEIDVEFEFESSGTRSDIHPLFTKGRGRPRKVPKHLGLSSVVELEAGSTSLEARAQYIDLDTGKHVATRQDPLDLSRGEHMHLWFIAAYGISRALPDATSTPSLARPSIDRMQPLFNSQTTDMEGLVLLDEIDLYLHPAWQATFVTALRRVFPKMQFVATTHSPVILAGLAPHEIVRLEADPVSGDVVKAGWEPSTGELVVANGHNWPQPDPRPMTGSEIYHTWFGVDRLTPNPHGESLRRYLVLAEDPFRSDPRNATSSGCVTS